MLLTRSPLSEPRKVPTVRLACLIHAASVRPEPGSNSPSFIMILTYWLAQTSIALYILQKNYRLPTLSGQVMSQKIAPVFSQHKSLRFYILGGVDQVYLACWKDLRKVEKFLRWVV